MSLLKSIYLWLAFSFFGDSLTEEEIQAHLNRLRQHRKTANPRRAQAIAREITYWNRRLIESHDFSRFQNG